MAVRQRTPSLSVLSSSALARRGGAGRPRSHARPGRRPGAAGRSVVAAFTMRQYVQTDLEADREVATILADLIGGGLLVTEVDAQSDEPDPGRRGVKGCRRDRP